MKTTNKQLGQIAIISLLIIVTVLAIALSVVGRSTTELSSSSRTEESSRALSAAEGGLEQALYQLGTGSTAVNIAPNSPFGNNTSLSVQSFSLPASGLALAYPPITKSDFAQFWLANPTQVDANGVPASYYMASTFNVYFGMTAQDLINMNLSGHYTSAPDDQPALEVRLISFNGSGYESASYLFDSYSGRNPPNNFQLLSCGSFSVSTNTGSPDDQKSFYCRIQITVKDGSGNSYMPSVSHYPVMARARILYSSLAHPVAVEPISGYNLYPQANIVESTGTIANVQRKISVFQQQNVLPIFLDFALFSGGSLSK